MASREWLEVPREVLAWQLLFQGNTLQVWAFRGPAPLCGQSCCRLLGCDFSLSKGHSRLQALWGHSDL